MLGGVFLMFLLVFIDLLTKWLAAATNVSQGEYFLGFIRLQFTTNPGIAFGWAGDNRTIMLVITALTVVLILGIALLYFTVFKRNAPVQYCLAIVEAGAVGNLIDRLCLGHVRDMIDISPLRLGVCNVADFLVCGGAVALVFVMLFIGKHAVFPLTKKWREEGRKEDMRREQRRAARKQVEEKINSSTEEELEERQKMLEEMERKKNDGNG